MLQPSKFAKVNSQSVDLHGIRKSQTMIKNISFTSKTKHIDYSKQETVSSLSKKNPLISSIKKHSDINTKNRYFLASTNDDDQRRGIENISSFFSSDKSNIFNQKCTLSSNNRYKPNKNNENVNLSSLKKNLNFDQMSVGVEKEKSLFEGKLAYKTTYSDLLSPNGKIDLDNIAMRYDDLKKSIRFSPLRASTIHHSKPFSLSSERNFHEEIYELLLEMDYYIHKANECLERSRNIH